jgi:hypothetical protein
MLNEDKHNAMITNTNDVMLAIARRDTLILPSPRRKEDEGGCVCPVLTEHLFFPSIISGPSEASDNPETQ